jgi:hypothetical protein
MDVSNIINQKHVRGVTGAFLGFYTGSAEVFVHSSVITKVFIQNTSSRPRQVPPKSFELLQ